MDETKVKDEFNMNQRDPRITFAVCVGHACEEAMEALEVQNRLEKLMDEEMGICDGDDVVRKKFREALDNFMEEISDLIYATRRLAFYAKAENKVTNPMAQHIIDSISGDYQAFKCDPIMEPIDCAINVSLYANRTLRTLGIGYPSRHAFDDEFNQFLLYLRETMRICIYKTIPKLVSARTLESGSWKGIIQTWINMKVERKRNADALEGNHYVDSGY